MTLLSVAQEVALNIGITKPTEIMSSVDREVEELRDVMKDMAERISQGHDWNTLTKIATITGDATTTAHDLPGDYDRMIVETEVRSSSLETALTHITSMDRWLELLTQSFDYVINAWTIYGGQIHIRPAMSATETAKFFYISNQIASNGGTPKEEFTADDDTFRLDEKLWKLGIIWQWKENKGQSYAEDLETYEERKERLVTRDKGSKKIHMGRVRMPSDANVAYPQSIIP